MTPEFLIQQTRQLTLDTKLDQQTWEDKQYLLALNLARAQLFSRCPESRVTADGDLTMFTPTEETDISEDLLEDAVYVPFFVEYMASCFFSSDSRDTENSRKAVEHRKAAFQALAGVGGER
jgi:hypothetical protein